MISTFVSTSQIFSAVCAKPPESLPLTELSDHAGIIDLDLATEYISRGVITGKGGPPTLRIKRETFVPASVKTAWLRAQPACYAETWCASPALLPKPRHFKPVIEMFKKFRSLVQRIDAFAGY